MRKFFKGDSLIEVLIAFTIFSAVAVSAIGTIRSTLARAQGTIEDTAAQLEIRSQSEALRFIQEAYLASPSNEFYAALWKKICEYTNPFTASETPISDIIQTDYSSHNAPYNKDDEDSASVYNLHAFILNLRLIGTESTYNNLPDDQKDDYINKIIVGANKENTVFSSATTYPRVIYASGSEEEDADVLASNPNNNEIYTNLARAEGIWIVGVSGEKGDFIDFYVRTCWDALGTPVPDKISTTIRLAEPSKVVSFDPIAHNEIIVNFHYKDKSGDKQVKQIYAQGASRGSTVEIATEFPTTPDPVYYNSSTHRFVGWKIGTDNQNEDSNWTYEEDIDYYCPAINPDTHKCIGSKLSPTITFDANTYNATKQVDLYAINRPRVAITILVDISNSMADEIRTVRNELGNLVKEINDADGNTRLFAIGGNPEFANIDWGRWGPKNQYTNGINSWYSAEKDNLGDYAMFNWSYGNTSSAGKNYCMKNINHGLKEIAIGNSLSNTLANIKLIGDWGYQNDYGQQSFFDSDPESCSYDYINNLFDYYSTHEEYNKIKKAILYMTDAPGGCYLYGDYGDNYTCWPNSQSQFQQTTFDGLKQSSINKDIKLYIVAPSGETNWWNNGAFTVFNFNQIGSKGITFDIDGNLYIK